MKQARAKRASRT